MWSIAQRRTMYRGKIGTESDHCFSTETTPAPPPSMSSLARRIVLSSDESDKRSQLLSELLEWCDVALRTLSDDRGGSWESMPQSRIALVDAACGLSVGQKIRWRIVYFEVCATLCFWFCLRADAHGWWLQTNVVKERRWRRVMGLHSLHDRVVSCLAWAAPWILSTIDRSMCFFTSQKHPIDEEEDPHQTPPHDILSVMTCRHSSLCAVCIVSYVPCVLMTIKGIALDMYIRLCMIRALKYVGICHGLGYSDSNRHSLSLRTLPPGFRARFSFEGCCPGHGFCRQRAMHALLRDTTNVLCDVVVHEIFRSIRTSAIVSREIYL